MEILYEDNHLIAVNKKVSELVQGDKTGDATLADRVKEYIRVKYKKPGEAFIGIVHRIDRPVSGVVLFARTSKALTRLNEMFREQQISKKYLAIVKERPPAEEGTLVNFLKKNEEQNRSYAYPEKVKGSREASLSYLLIGHSNRYYLLEIDLHSGRHHQIRCQLAHAGSPVKGDLKYGYSRSNEDGGISLHARSLSFVHPVTKEKILIKAPLPGNDIWPLFAGMVK
ncbi:MAG: RluA family pseudouridine synthase [Bacteroidales bacterium]|nr:RluA family pseudouridine synthase [Bacteroidales bacterium]